MPSQRMIILVAICRAIFLFDNLGKLQLMACVKDDETHSADYTIWLSMRSSGQRMFCG